MVDRSARDTEPDWIHFSIACAEDAANGHSPACVAAKGAEKDHFDYSLCFHLCNCEEGQQGVRARRRKPLPLAVDEGPYFDAARGLLGGT
ncbi:MAG: hypothetical protein ACE5JU_24660, partial [Candidatus Binatia bacterium]